MAATARAALRQGRACRPYSPLLAGARGDRYIPTLSAGLPAGEEHFGRAERSAAW